MALRSYQELIGWKKGIELVTDVYRLTQKFPKQEIYGLTSQIRRAAVSIPSNIAEGQGRMSRGEFKQFLGHARGSVFEINMRQVVAGLVIIRMESETGDGLRHHTFFGQHIVIRPRKEILIGMGIAGQVCAMRGKNRPEI